jgi:membrane protease YdiL (CAAX protease family)
LSDRRPDTVTPVPDSGPRPVNDLPAPPGQWLFFGPRGLRAGWAILVYATLCAILVIVCEFAVGPFLHLYPGVPIPPSTGLLLELSHIVPVIAATAIMAAMERRPFLYYGFQGSARGVRLLSGLVWGFIAISVVVLILRHLGYLSLDGRTMGGLAALRYAVAWAAMFLLVGFCEEAMFRGYAQFTVTRGIGFWWGALLFCLPFGLMHASNPGESPAGLVGAGAASLIFCLSLWYTGSLWWAVGFHAAWDWGQSCFYGTADSGLVAQGHLFASHPVGKPLWSGGATGPEGSVIVIPLLLVIALLMAAWWGKRGEKPFRRMAWRPGRLP